MVAGDDACADAAAPIGAECVHEAGMGEVHEATGHGFGGDLQFDLADVDMKSARW